MTAYDLVGALKTYADSLGWAFIFGDNFRKNYEASRKSYAVNQLILAVDPVVATPSITYANKIPEITYTGLILLGRKFEATTEACLDETYKQKYDRRLLYLSQALSANMLLFACSQELTVSRLQFDLRINNLDANIDWVAATFTIVQEL